MELREDLTSFDSRNWALLALLSLLVHGVIFFLLLRFNREVEAPLSAHAVPRVLSTRVLTPQQFAREERESISPSARPSADRPQDRARFVSERTQRFEKESRVVPGSFGKEKNALPHAQAKEKPIDRLLSLPGRIPAPVRESVVTRSGETTAGVLDKDIAIGSENLLNADEYVYSSFYNRMRDEVGPRWKLLIDTAVQKLGRQVPRGSFRTKATIILDAEGEVVDVVLVESSGLRVFDEAAKTSILQSLRFRNPPRTLKEKDGTFHVKSQFVLENYGRSDFGTTYIPDPRLVPASAR